MLFAEVVEKMVRGMCRAQGRAKESECELVIGMEVYAGHYFEEGNLWTSIFGGWVDCGRVVCRFPLAAGYNLIFLP